ncbi:hypothetical protein [Deinococcus hohokamensis]|uniref:Uncharacterized protein n=1 Tax=Deinococcus hohokamensis TaxID=309883 RepID=A0ABV9I9G3_9DEIO
MANVQSKMAILWLFGAALWLIGASVNPFEPKIGLPALVLVLIGVLLIAGASMWQAWHQHRTWQAVAFTLLIPLIAAGLVALLEWLI